MLLQLFSQYTYERSAYITSATVEMAKENILFVCIETGTVCGFYVFLLFVFFINLNS